MLGLEPGLSANQVCQRLKGTYSHQAIYKELKKLMSQGIVVRRSKRYYLQASWIMNMHELTTTIYSRFLDKPQIDELLPEYGLTYRWSFRSLMDADNFWGHLLVVLLKHCKSRALFEFISHPWYELIHHHKENLFRDTLKRTKKRLYLVLRDHSSLSNKCLDFWTPDICEFSSAPGPFAFRSGLALNLMDDYIIELRLPPKLQQEIDHIFQSYEVDSKLVPSKVFQTFKSPAKVSISISHNPVKAKRLRRNFVEYFGLRKHELE